MSLLKLPILFEGSIRSETLLAVFDSRFNLSCISEKVALKLTTLLKLRRPRRFQIDEKSSFFETQNVALADFFINDRLLSDEFLVVPNQMEDVIFGDATIRKWRIKIDFENKVLKVE